MPESVTLIRPDDRHVHLRDGAMMRACLPATARAFGRVIVTPNLVTPVTTSAAAALHRERLRAAQPEGSDFAPPVDGPEVEIPVYRGGETMRWRVR